MDALIKQAAYLVAYLAESIAIIVILLGILKTIVFYLRSRLPFKFMPDMVLTLRTQLGGALSLSLEFLIGADILKTAISPNWNEIGMLAAIVGIRTILNYFLTQELHHEIKKAK